MPERKQRVDAYLREMVPGLSRRHVEEAIQHGLVRGHDGKKLKKGQLISAEPDIEKLEAHLAELRQGTPKIQIPVLKETSEWLAVDKPPGLAGHPLSLFDKNTVTHWAFAREPAIAEAFASAKVQPTITPHRLDSGTSGVLIVAKSPESYEKWREVFTQKKVVKKYLAWCWGNPSWENFLLEASVAHDPKDDRRMIVVSEDVSYEPPLLFASSEIKVLERKREELFLAEITCRTGVTHQVRVHLAFLGFPLVGDVLYDDKSGKRKFQPPFHQLRAVSLVAAGTEVTAPAADFIRADWMTSGT